MKQNIFVILLTFALHAPGLFSKERSQLPDDFTITSFNIKLYGQRQNSPGAPTAGERNETLKKFLSKDVPRSDIYVFEEIMNKEEFTSKVVDDLNCVSYTNPRTEHQYVLVCARKPYQLVVDSQVDTNYAIEEVAMGSLGQRPAVHALVSLQGKPLLRIIGTHLSAFPGNTSNRIEQASIISKHLHKTDMSIPTIITGDFNTYPSTLTGRPRSDVELLSEEFHQAQIDRPDHPSPYTFRSPEFRSKFDHFWKSETLQAKGPVKVTGYCNEADVNEEPSQEMIDYYRLISDHCPVTLKISTKNL